MAITIQQQPTSPGMVNSDIVFTVQSSVPSQPQFQYVMDIYESGSATRLQRIKQQPNPNTKGVFNIGQILKSYMSSDLVWKAAPFATSSNANKDFIVMFGEEYGTSLSSSLTLYNGISATAGNPAKSGSNFYTFTNGLVDPYDAVNWNFDSGSYYTSSAAPTGGSANFTRSSALTNALTTQSIADGDYATISLYNGNFNNSSTNAQDIYQVQVRVYNSASSNIQNITLTNLESAGGGPRANGTQEWGDSGVYNTQTKSTRLLHTGVGPQNLDDSGNALSGSWAYYIVDWIGQESAGIEDSSAIYASVRFNKETSECSYNGVRFAWKNEFGVWDYYTFTLQSDSAVNIERQSYEQTFVDYSTANTSVPYDKSRRGATQFYNALNQVKTANSNWLTQAEADWLRELFFSANVYIQDGTDFKPVVITSANVVEKTNPRTQKNFQYTIEFSPANQLRPRE